LRLAYISFEYPPDSAFGGIATYVRQAALLMTHRGHDVEVFCSSPYRSVSEHSDGVLVHRIACTSRDIFRSEILSVFQNRHLHEKFDLLESPEYYADGLEIKIKLPDLPLVVKLHTPQFLIHELGKTYVTPIAKFRYLAGGVRRGKIETPYWKWKAKEDDIDYLITKAADQIHTPSIALGDIVSKRWKINRRQISNVPYPFIANQAFLDLPLNVTGNTVTYIGRLEVRKGIKELTAAIPSVIRKVPAAKFRFVGKTLPSHIDGVSMKEFILSELHAYKHNLEFLELGWDEIPNALRDSSVCVFPSIWENFPNVCLEAMSAGKAIVASREGGMSDMLTDPKCGMLVDPMKPMAIAEAIIKLLSEPGLRQKYGELARNKVLTAYNNEKIGKLMEDQYKKVINKWVTE
jgi:glycogen(starch) synthase